MMGKIRKIYTDGSADNRLPDDKRVGGYAAIITSHDPEDNQVSVISSADLGLNSYEAELMGFICGLMFIHNAKLKKAKIVTDCKVIVDAFAKGWLEKWKEEDWWDVKGQSQWKIIDNMYHDGIVVEWVKGHSGVELNEKADQEAKKARIELEKQLGL